MKIRPWLFTFGAVIVLIVLAALTKGEVTPRSIGYVLGYLFALYLIWLGLRRVFRRSKQTTEKGGGR